MIRRELRRRETKRSSGGSSGESSSGKEEIEKGVMVKDRLLHTRSSRSYERG